MSTPAPTADDHTHLVHNGKTLVPLDTLGRWQPGMDRLMAELGPRVHRLAYAGWARNWPLAMYFYRSVVKNLKMSVEARPKYATAMDAYLTDDCGPVADAIRAENGAAFDAAYDNLIVRANELHVEFSKPYLVWQTPANPPEDLDLTAGMSSPTG